MGPVGPKCDAGRKGQKGDMGPAGMPGAKGEPGESTSAPLLLLFPPKYWQLTKMDQLRFNVQWVVSLNLQ